MLIGCREIDLGVGRYINEFEIDLLVEYFSREIQEADRCRRVRSWLETDLGAMNM